VAEAVQYLYAGTKRTSQAAAQGQRGQAGKGTVHGNSQTSTKPQHVYEILRTDALGTEVHKFGISGGKINQAGQSARAQSQVRAANRAEQGTATYESSIVERIPGGCSARSQALAREKSLVYQYRDLMDAKPVGNILP
jgi:hypothetical protein